MERSRRDLPLYLGSALAVAVTGAIIYVTVDAATISATFDSNTPNATTGGPPAAFETP
jgi:hypothetical protein